MMVPSRLCPACGAREPVLADEPVWPVGWTCRACGQAIAVADGFSLFAPALADTVTGINPENFVFLSRVEQDHFWFVPRNRLICSLIDRYLPGAGTILEIGCGTGMVLSALAGGRAWQRIAGSELHPKGLTVARQRLGERAELVQMDARAIPAEQVFDVIGAFDVIEHIEEDTAVLCAMNRAVRAGGGIAISVPQHPWLWSAADDLGHHVRRYRRGELEAKVRDAGFDVVFSGSYNALLLPLMAASRFKARLSRRRDAPPSEGLSAVEAEFTIPVAVNGLLKAILQAEVSMTMAGVRFPGGGSRLVLATKAGN